MIKVNSYDKTYAFTDSFGTVSTFCAPTINDALKQYRDHLAHICRLSIDRAIKVVETSSVAITK